MHVFKFQCAAWYFFIEKHIVALENFLGEKLEILPLGKYVKPCFRLWNNYIE